MEVVEEKGGHNIGLPQIKWNCDQNYIVSIIDFMYFKKSSVFETLQVLSHVIVLVVGPLVIYIFPLIFLGWNMPII